MPVKWIWQWCDHLGCGALHHLSFIQTDAPPLHSHKRARNGHVALLVTESAAVFAIAVGDVDVIEFSAQHVISGDDHILLS